MSWDCVEEYSRKPICKDRGREVLGRALKEKEMIITFEQGLYELCAGRIGQDEEYRRLHPGRDGEADENIFQEYRTFQLQRTIRHVYEHSPFYRKQFDRYGIIPDEIREFRDLERLPFTRPEDLRGSGYGLLCVSQRDVERPVTFYSSGTTGIRKRIYFSKSDIRHITDFIGIAMNTIADTENTRILSMITNSEGRGASELFARSVRSRGMDAVVGDMAASSEDLLALSVSHRCNVWFGDITTMYRIAKEMEDQADLGSLGMKLLFVTMGHISKPMRMYMERTFACKVIAHYGLTEVGWGFAIECGRCGGYHYNELDVYTEVIDPITGSRVQDGTVGELTYTTIGRDAMPLIRYRSGDMAYCRDSGCGQRLRVIGPIMRRLEGAFETKAGNLVYPAMLEEVIYSVDEIEDYRPYIDGNQLVLYAELSRESESVRERLMERLETLPELSGMERPRIELLPSGTLRKFCFENKHIQEIGRAVEIWQE